MSEITSWAGADGAFRRQPSSFRGWVRRNSQFPPAAGRYHLYVSLACPWAHRTLIFLALKGLKGCIGVSIVDYLMGKDGWKFSSPEETEGCIPDPHMGAKYLRELYFNADPQYSGRFTVPVLWDIQQKTIVNNESSEIIRMLNSEFNDFAENPSLDLCPAELLPAIDKVNTWVYDMLNNGVYKAGFATAQHEYEEKAKGVHEGLLRVEAILEKNRFLVGDQFTEADIRLFTTIVRFDPVYFGHFKCNMLAIRDCPNILKWLRVVANMPGVRSTINMTHIKRHYYMSHTQINPNKIVPLSDGPSLDLE